jgi:hypothetical protein
MGPRRLIGQTQAYVKTIKVHDRRNGSLETALLQGLAPTIKTNAAKEAVKDRLSLAGS